MDVSDGTRSAFDQILLVTDPAANVRPKAQIEYITSVVVGTEMALDGTQSYDFDGDFLAYSWSLLHSPTGSIAAVTSASSPVAAMTADIAGLYIVQLQVTDADASSVPVTYAFVAGAPLPIAEAGPDRLSGDQGQITLDGTLSAGVALSYAWSSIGLTGDGSSGTIDGSDLAMPLFGLEIREGRFRDVIKTASVFHFKRSDTGGLCQMDTRLPADIPGVDPDEAVSITLHARGRQTVGGETVLIWEVENKKQPPALCGWRTMMAMC